MADAPSDLSAQTPTTVVVIGASGFIGRHVQRQLLAAGHPVRALVRSSSRRLQPGSQLHVANLGSPGELRAGIGGAAAVIYLAGTVRGRHAIDFRAANVDGVANTARVLASHFPQTPMLLMSSLAASAPDLSDYAQSKAAGERALKESGHRHWTIFRPPAVYGPGDTELRGTLSVMRRGLVPMAGPAEQRLPFIEVTDLAAATNAWLAHSAACNQQTFAIDDGTSGGYDWATLARLLAPRAHLRIRVPYPLLRALGSVNLALSRVAGYAPMLTPGKARELRYVGWSCSNEAFTKATGWQPRVSLADGVARLFDKTLQTPS